MTRPKGSKTQNTGLTFFFTLNKSVQVALHKDTSKHLSYQVYVIGVPTAPSKRTTYTEAARMLSMSEQDLKGRFTDFDSYRDETKQERNETN